MNTYSGIEVVTSIPVKRKAHQSQFPATPLSRTKLVTRLGVSEEKVVATMETPKSHQGIFLPDKKKAAELLPADLAAYRPTPKETAKNPKINVQSSVERFMKLVFFVCLINIAKPQNKKKN